MATRNRNDDAVFYDDTHLAQGIIPPQEIVIEMRQVIATVPLVSDGSGIDPFRAALYAIGDKAGEYIGPSAFAVSFELYGRTHHFTIDAEKVTNER